MIIWECNTMYCREIYGITTMNERKAIRSWIHLQVIRMSIQHNLKIREINNQSIKSNSLNYEINWKIIKNQLSIWNKSLKNNRNLTKKCSKKSKKLIRTLQCNKNHNSISHIHRIIIIIIITFIIKLIIVIILERKS